MDTSQLETEIIVFSDETPTDTLLALTEKVDLAKQVVRECERQLKEKMIERIQRDGPIEYGTIRYYVGNDKEDKCQDVKATLDAVLQTTAGDMDAASLVLSSNAFKPGACKKLLGDRFGEFFTTTEKVVLKEGKPAKQLQKLDTRFLK